MKKIISYLFVFLIAGVLGYMMAPEPKRSQAVERFEPEHMAMLFAHHKFSDDFWNWELERRITLIDALVHDPVLSKARYHWGFEAYDQAGILTLARRVRDIQIAAYRDDALLPDLQAPYLGLSALWVQDARGLYQQTSQSVLINRSVNWQDLPFDALLSVVLHEVAHHIYSTLGEAMLDDHFAARHSVAFRDDAYILWLNSPKGGHVYFGEKYILNPQERLAWDAQNMARFTGLSDRRAVPLSSLSQRLDELETLKNRWLTL